MRKYLIKKAMSIFWESLDKYTSQMIEGFHLANARKGKLTQAYDDESFNKIAIGLNAYSKIIIPIIAGLTGKYEK